MRIFNDSIENSVGVSSIDQGEYIGVGYTGYLPPANGLIVQGKLGIGTYLPAQVLDVNGSVIFRSSLYDSNNSSGFSNWVLTSTGSAIIWNPVSNIGILTGLGTPTTVPKYGTPGGSLVNSSITDNGTAVSISEATVINNTLTVTGNTYIQGSAIVLGGLTVLGTSTIIQTQYLNVYDPIISLGDESVAYDTYIRGVVIEYFPISGIGTTGFMGVAAPNYDTLSYYNQIQYSGTAPTNSAFITLGNSLFNTGWFLGNLSVAGLGVVTNFIVTNYHLMQSGYTNQGTGYNTNISITGSLFDTNNSSGSNNQILSSTGSAITWITQSGGGNISGTISAPEIPFVSASNTLTGVSTFVYYQNKIGIGTATPSAILHIEATTGLTTGIAIFGNPTGLTTTPYLSIGTSDVTPGNIFVVAGAGNTNVTTVGNIGIHTANPTQALDVNGTTRLRGLLYDSKNTAPIAGQLLSAVAGGTEWQTSQQLSIPFYTVPIANTIVVWISNQEISSISTFCYINKRMGLGTSLPFALLDIETIVGNQTGLMINGPFGGGQTAPLLSIGSSNTTLALGGYFIVTGIGSVGIGTPMPTNLLSINGNLNLTGSFKDLNNNTGIQLGIVTQYLASINGLGVSWMPVKRSIVAELMTAYTVLTAGIDSAMFIFPYDPNDGMSIMNFTFKRVVARCETTSSIGITTINISKSIGTSVFSGTNILLNNILISGTNEGFSTSFGISTAQSGDKIAANFVGTAPVFSNFTIQIIARET